MDLDRAPGSRLTRPDLERRWGSAWLTTQSAQTVTDLGLPVIAGRVLQELGLPNGVPALFTASPVPVRSAAVLPAEAAGATLVGHVWNDEFDLLVAPGETVYARQVSGELTPVNRDLECYLIFLLSAAAMEERMEAVDSGELSRADYERILEQQKETMRRTDPDALTDGWWWSGVADEFQLV
jgi:hypothetical protein